MGVLNAGVFLKLILLLPVLLPASDRITLTGQVCDDQSGKPLAFVNVFIANTMLGSTTDEAGKFTIRGVPMGTRELVISHIGYEVRKIELRLTTAADLDFAIKLTPKTWVMPEVEVVASKNREWQKRLRQFAEYFLGTSQNAQQCKIVNPEMLDFQANAQSFSATAADILVIDNLALGYRVHFLLEYFNLESDILSYFGRPRFEFLQAENSRQQKQWQENRRRTFLGSQRHFLAALCTNKVDEEGFTVDQVETVAWEESMAVKRNVSVEAMVAPGSVSFERVVDFTDYLRLVYRDEHESPEYVRWAKLDGQATAGIQQRPHRAGAQISWITLNTPSAVVDTTGYLYSPLAVTVYGYWAWERVAEMLPYEYTPGKQNTK